MEDPEFEIIIHHGADSDVDHDSGNLVLSGSTSIDGLSPEGSDIQESEYEKEVHGDLTFSAHRGSEIPDSEGQDELEEEEDVAEKLSSNLGFDVDDPEEEDRSADTRRMDLSEILNVTPSPPSSPVNDSAARGPGSQGEWGSLSSTPRGKRKRDVFRGNDSDSGDGYDTLDTPTPTATRVQDPHFASPLTPCRGLLGLDLPAFSTPSTPPPSSPTPSPSPTKKTRMDDTLIPRTNPGSKFANTMKAKAIAMNRPNGNAQSSPLKMGPPTMSRPSSVMSTPPLSERKMLMSTISSSVSPTSPTPSLTSTLALSSAGAQHQQFGSSATHYYDVEQQPELGFAPSQLFSASIAQSVLTNQSPTNTTAISTTYPFHSSSALASTATVSGQSTTATIARQSTPIATVSPSLLIPTRRVPGLWFHSEKMVVIRAEHRPQARASSTRDYNPTSLLNQQGSSGTRGLSALDDPFSLTVDEQGVQEYRLLASILSSKSVELAKMVRAATAGGSDGVEGGTSIVMMRHPAHHVEPFLRAIYDSGFFEPPPKKTTLDTILGVLSLSHRYNVPYLKRRAILHLETVYAYSLAAHEVIHADINLDINASPTTQHSNSSPTFARTTDFSVPHSGPSTSAFSPFVTRTLTVLRIAHDCGVHWILPSVFYECCRYDFEHLLGHPTFKYSGMLVESDSRGVGEVDAEPTPPQGHTSSSSANHSSNQNAIDKNHILSKSRLLTSYFRQSKESRNLLLSLLSMPSSDGCQRASFCLEVRRKWMVGVNNWGVCDPLGIWGEGEWGDWVSSGSETGVDDRNGNDASNSGNQKKKKGGNGRGGRAGNPSQRKTELWVLCDICESEARDMLRKVKEDLWERLPELYGLVSWERLMRMREEAMGC